MITNKAIIRLTSIAALTLITTGVTMAQVPGRFGFSTLFSPNPIQSSNVIYDFVQVNNNSTPINDAPTQINLENFIEFARNFDPISGAPLPAGTINQPFTLKLTLTPDGGAPQTQQFSGTFTGTITQTSTSTNLTVNNPGSLTYNFGSLGIYTVNTLNFTPPGNSNSQTAGALSAEVTYQPVPEASTTVSLGLLLALGLGGVIVASRRKACKA